MSTNVREVDRPFKCRRMSAKVYELQYNSVTLDMLVLYTLYSCGAGGSGLV